MDVETDTESLQASGGYEGAKKRKKSELKQQDSQKRKQTSISLNTKIEICKAKESNPRIKNVELASRFNVGKSTVCEILKKRDYFLSLQTNDYTGSLYRERPSKYPTVEQALALWIDQATADNYTLSGHIISNKAADFAKRLDIVDFGGSNGWLDRFKKRYNVQQYTRCGEANSAPLDDLPQYRIDLQNLLAGWDLDNVYNCDETALYWKLEPSKTLARRPLSGTKKAKDRVTVLLACNATGTSKLKPVFIHKFKTPRCMRNIRYDDLPVHYYWNSSAWMQGSIFLNWLGKVNADLRKKRQHILLLLDNATVHALEEGLLFSNIMLHYFPPNTTSHLQPCDAGIIYSFKVSKFCMNSSIFTY